jgi:hypothetical protein
MRLLALADSASTSRRLTVTTGLRKGILSIEPL